MCSTSVIRQKEDRKTSLLGPLVELEVFLPSLYLTTEVEPSLLIRKSSPVLPALDRSLY
jgi:hypothetical protein